MLYCTPFMCLSPAIYVPQNFSHEQHLDGKTVLNFTTTNNMFGKLMIDLVEKSFYKDYTVFTQNFLETLEILTTLFSIGFMLNSTIEVTF